MIDDESLNLGEYWFRVSLKTNKVVFEELSLLELLPTPNQSTLNPN